MLLHLKFVQEYACTSRLCKLKFSKLRNVQCGMGFQIIAVRQTISYSPWKDKYAIYECRRNDSKVLIEPKATDMTEMRPRNLDSLIAPTDEETLIENCFHLNCTSGGLQNESKSNFPFDITDQVHAHQSSYSFDAYNITYYHAISHHMELMQIRDMLINHHITHCWCLFIMPYLITWS